MRCLGRGQLCSCKSNTLCTPMKWSDIQKEGALIRGQLLKGVGVLSYFKASHHQPRLQGSLTDKLPVMLLYFAGSNQNVSCPNTPSLPALSQNSSAHVNLKLQGKKEVDSHRSGSSSPGYQHPERLSFMFTQILPQSYLQDK